MKIAVLAVQCAITHQTWTLINIASGGDKVMGLAGGGSPKSNYA